MKHELLEKNVGWLIVLILIAVSFGGAVEIFPMVLEKAQVGPIEGLEPYSALGLLPRPPVAARCTTTRW